MVGAADSQDHPRIAAIAPLIPIVPALVKDLHRMWQSYGGFTYAFKDYLKIGLSDHIDDQLSVDGYAKMDPITFPQQLSKIPKLIVMSSNDEFMQLDWSSIWGD